MPRPSTGRRQRATLLRAALPCLAVIAAASPLKAQTLTSDLLRPVRDGFLTPQDSFLRKTSDKTGDNSADQTADPADAQRNNKTPPAPSRIGAIPKYGLPAASGASEAGYDSLNRKRKQPKFYPGQVKPKPSPGPGTPVPAEAKGPANPNARVRISPPPSLSANRSPMPAAMAGTAVGQPARKPLPVDIDPFGAVGDYAGSFLIKSAVELRGGYETNPGNSPNRSAHRSGWWRLNFSRSPTGSGMRWLPICGAPLPDTATAFRRSWTVEFRPRRLMSTGRISWAMSTAASM